MNEKKNVMHKKITLVENRNRLNPRCFF